MTYSFPNLEPVCSTSSSVIISLIISLVRKIHVLIEGSLFPWLETIFYLLEVNVYFLYWFCHTSTWICHWYTCVPILKPPPSSLPIPSLWVVPVHQPQASSIMRWTWAGDSFHIWYYTCFNAILPNHPTLSLSYRVQKTILYICVSFTVSHTGLSLPSF